VVSGDAFISKRSLAEAVGEGPRDGAVTGRSLADGFERFEIGPSVRPDLGQQ
jgi:hypothetical protein